MKIDVEKINEAMAEKGIFPKDLCSRLNITEREVKIILIGGRNVDTRTAARISSVLGVKIRDIEKTGDDYDSGAVSGKPETAEI